MLLPFPAGGYCNRMLIDQLRRTGVRSWVFHGISLGCIWLCLSLWIRARTVDQESRGNAERRAMFVGLWPSMFWLIGDALERREQRVTRGLAGLRARSRGPRALR